MKLNRTLLEQYLDSELTPAETAQVDQALRADAAATALLGQLRRERALRVAALRSYAPGAEEAQQLAGIWIDDFATAPVGEIRPAARWLHRAMQIAAGLIIALGSYYAGHATQPGKAPTNDTVAEVSATPYVLEVKRDGQVVDHKEFNSLEDAQQYADAMQQQQQEDQPVQMAAGGVF